MLKLRSSLLPYILVLLVYPMCSVISSGILLHWAWWQVTNDNSNDIFETMDDLPRPFPSCLKSLFQRLDSIGKSGFRFWNPDFGFGNRTRNPNTDFMDFLFTIWNPKKGFAKLFSWTAVFFLLIMHARSRPLSFRTIFKKLYRISQSYSKKEISALKSLFLRVRLWIRNPYYKI